jgi:magnesium chelatase subunit D
VDASRVFGRPPRRDRLERTAVGRRARSLVDLRRGKYSRHRLGTDRADVALDATLRAAASRGRRRIEPDDLRRKVREHRSPFAVCFVVDNSYSVHADRMVERVKGLTMALLEDAAHRGDRVALVAFRGGVPEATVALPLTRSLVHARRRLEEIPLSGRTPLADALVKAGRLLRQEQFKRPNAYPLVVVVTDGLPTVPLRRGGDPLADVLAEGRALRRAGISVVVADATPPGSGAKSCGPALAGAAGGLHLAFADLVPETLQRLLDGADGAG